MKLRKPRRFRKVALVLAGTVVGAYAAATIGYNIRIKQSEAGVIQPTISSAPAPDSVTLEGLWVATNRERKASGAQQVALEPILNQSAQAKCEDMAERNYWAHITPEGNDPWVFLEGAGYRYGKAGENLAYGFKGSDDVVHGWMISPTHRENLLNQTFNKVGFGICRGQNYQGRGLQEIIVQHFSD